MKKLFDNLIGSSGTNARYEADYQCFVDVFYVHKLRCSEVDEHCQKSSRDNSDDGNKLVGAIDFLEKKLVNLANDIAADNYDWHISNVHMV